MLKGHARFVTPSRTVRGGCGDLLTSTADHRESPAATSVCCSPARQTQDIRDAHPTGSKPTGPECLQQRANQVKPGIHHSSNIFIPLMECVIRQPSQASPFAMGHGSIRRNASCIQRRINHKSQEGITQQNDKVYSDICFHFQIFLESWRLG